MQERKLYEKYKPYSHWQNHPTSYAELFSNFLREHKFKGTIIDAGCGTGRDINFFNQYGFDARGIDISEENIKTAKESFPNSKFEIQEIEHLKFDDNSVDAIFMINVIHYLKKEKAIKQIFRVLKPGSYFFIHFNLEIIDKDGNIDYFQSEEEVLELVSKFNIIHAHKFNRLDSLPVEHKHTIFELILQKPETSKKPKK